MKNILRLLISITCLSLAKPGFEQIILTANDLPAVGEAQISIKVDSLQAATLSEGQVGENQIWNFNNLIPCCGLPASEDTVKWFAAGNVDPNNSFPGATMAVNGHFYTYHSHVTHTDVTVFHHKFYYKDAEGLKFYGTDYPANAISQPSQLVRPLLSYGDSKVVYSRLVFELTADSLETISVTDSIFADGWGTIITPTDTFSTIRYRTAEYSIDSLFVNGSLVSVENDNGTSWKWFTNGVRFPVLQIGEGSLSTLAGSRSAEYSLKSENLLGIDDPVANQFPVKVFPNPFQTHTSFQFGSSNPKSTLSLEIYDGTGRLVNQVTHISASEIIIDRGGLPSGIYFYRVLSSGSLVNTGKLVIR